ncbi:MAG: cytochrome ubiquinol oxidase subunit I, partial [Microbacterium sp.]|nr:cytochrome ubiquinol oxidase subunit I [Microbacterium sp.]
MTATVNASTGLIPGRPVERKGNVFVKWVTTTDHKVIGHLYFVTSFLFFLIGGVMALLIRGQL